VEGDYLTKVLAFMVQQLLDEHKRAIPDFGVRLFVFCFFMVMSRTVWMMMVFRSRNRLIGLRRRCL
jgi:hypothetical protein